MVSLNIIFLVIIIVSILFFVHRKLENTSTSVKNELPNSDKLISLRDRNNKPDEDTIFQCLTMENYNLYNVLKIELAKLGIPDFLWRGNENGWVLTLRNSEGLNGSIILIKEKLIGQMVLSPNQNFGMKTDPRLPKELSLDFWLSHPNDSISNNQTFIELPIVSDTDAINFIKLMELNIYYA